MFLIIYLTGKFNILKPLNPNIIIDISNNYQNPQHIFRQSVISLLYFCQDVLNREQKESIMAVTQRAIIDNNLDMHNPWAIDDRFLKLDERLNLYTFLAEILSEQVKWYKEKHEETVKSLLNIKTTNSVINNMEGDIVFIKALNGRPYSLFSNFNGSQEYRSGLIENIEDQIGPMKDLLAKLNQLAIKMAEQIESLNELNENKCNIELNSISRCQV